MLFEIPTGLPAEVAFFQRLHTGHSQGQFNPHESLLFASCENPAPYSIMNTERFARL